MSFAIRYLDPDLKGDSTKKKAQAQRLAGVGLLILAIGLSLYFTVLRWLPALIRLMR